MIKFFKGAAGFLASNYIGVPIEFEGDKYKTLEHAYQAAKQSKDMKTCNEYRRIIRLQKYPTYATQIGSICVLRPNWHSYRIKLMKNLLTTKFTDKKMKFYLQETYPSELECGNYIHDNFWGVCYCPECHELGKNTLGKMLMEHRELISNY